MELRVGTSTLAGGIEKYAARFDLLELRGEPGRLPRVSKLGEMRKHVGPDFVFAVVLPRSVSTLDGTHQDHLKYALDAANALSAQWLVLRTEASIMPSSRTRKRLTDLLGSLERQRRIAWEPSGVWEEREAIALATELDVHLVRDATREELPPGELVYTRLRALGRTSLSLGALEQVAERILDRESACVVIEGEGVGRAAQSLRELTGQSDKSEDDDGDDDENDGEDDDDDDEDEEEAREL
jgi:uncharacterized protein YecE (DUF72 family)